MANHKNTKKAVRSSATKRLRNRYYAKTTRNMMKNLFASKDKKEATEMLPAVHKEIDKLVKRNIYHANKGASLKSQLAKHVNTL
tara:strand:+ start:3153 stop:3404 length:252 start_codon:yes stop_codon:yes gene_type:complete